MIPFNSLIMKTLSLSYCKILQVLLWKYPISLVKNPKYICKLPQVHQDSDVRQHPLTYACMRTLFVKVTNFWIL